MNFAFSASAQCKIFFYVNFNALLLYTAAIIVKYYLKRSVSKLSQVTHC